MGLVVECKTGSFEVPIKDEKYEFEQGGMVIAACSHKDHYHLLTFDHQGGSLGGLRRNQVLDMYPQTSPMEGPRVQYEDLGISFRLSPEAAQRIQQGGAMDKCTCLCKSSDNHVYKLVLGKGENGPKVDSARPVDLIQ